MKKRTHFFKFKFYFKVINLTINEMIYQSAAPIVMASLIWLFKLGNMVFRLPAKYSRHLLQTRVLNSRKSKVIN